MGLKFSFTGDTLSDPTNPVLLETISFPEPVISIAIEPKTKADQDRMSESLVKLSEEDPTFRVRQDEVTGQTVISGMGELHLDVLVTRLLREFKVKANVGKPRVAYREAITKPVMNDEYRYSKQTGGHGQYGHVIFDLEPLESVRVSSLTTRSVAARFPKNLSLPLKKASTKPAKAVLLLALL